jgi:hypothetical protein
MIFAHAGLVPWTGRHHPGQIPGRRFPCATTYDVPCTISNDLNSANQHSNWNNSLSFNCTKTVPAWRKIKLVTAPDLLFDAKLF